MRFGVLGPVTVWTDAGEPVAVPERKVRTLLAALLVEPGRPVSAARLIDHLWGGELPTHPTRSLQAKVSQLRRVLDDAEPGARTLLESRAPGYALRADDLDAAHFDALLRRARTSDRPDHQVALLDEALGLWDGPAFADFEESPFTRSAAERLAESRLAAYEDHAEARLRLGQHQELAAELSEQVKRHPLRERLRSVQLRALYRSGRQTEALAGYAELRQHLAEELGLDPSPELAALHQALLTHDETLAVPPTTPAPARRAPLPAPLTELVGRDAALMSVRTLVESRRLVTLTGPGGVGKSRLALAVSQQLLDTFPDGVLFVELAGATGELAEVVSTVAGVRDDVTWGATAGRDPEPSVERLAAALQAKRLLLVLDNCEHVVDEAASLVERLLRAAPGLRVLATSQESLALAGETVWPVPTLDVPSAVALFVARAQAAAPGFTLDAANSHDVTAICACLDGIPLALELAATRVRTLGVAGVRARLRDRFLALGSGRRSAPPRQQTLRAMIDWSWELLTDPERRALRRLAAHADSCTLDAAEAVCADPDLPAEDVVDLLVRLVERSLVTVTDTPQGPRYGLLKSVAAYCEERMAEAGELASVRARHRTYYLALAERSRLGLRGPEQSAWLDRLDLETANLRAAHDDAVRHEPALALRLSCALAWYWTLRGRLHEARRSLTSALDAAPPERSTTRDSAIVEDSPPAALRAEATVWLTGVSILTGEGSERIPRISAAVAAYEAGDPPGGSAWVRWFLAHTLCGTGGLREGEQLTDRALTDFRARGDRWGTAAALADRSMQRLLKGDLPGADADGTASAGLFAELGDEAGQLLTVYPRCSVAEVHADYARATALYREGLAAAERLRLAPQAVDLLAGLGRVALLTGELAESRALHERARRQAAELGFLAGEFNAILGLGLLARRTGQLDEAVAHLAQVHDWHESVGLHGANALVLAELGFVAELRGDVETARVRHRESFAAAGLSDDIRALALALEGLAGAEALAERPRQAALLLGAAHAARARAQAPLPTAERGDVDRTTARARARLDAPAFDTAFDEGRHLSPDEALARV